MHHSVNPEILEKLLQEAQRESLLSHPSSPKPYLPISSPVKSSIYCDHLIESSTPILVDLNGLNNGSQLLMSNITSPIKLIESPIIDNHSLPCNHCSRHQKQIDILLEKQIDQEKLLISLRKEYEQKLLTKSPEFMLSSQSSISSSSASDNEFNPEDNEKTIHSLKDIQQQTNIGLKRQNSSTSTLIAVGQQCQQQTQLMNQNSTDLSSQVNYGYSSGIYNYKKNNDQADWMKYWSSRPQTQPPK